MEDFNVLLNKKQVITASLPLQEHWLPLSNLDLLLPPVDFSIFFCYKRSNENENDFRFNVLKTSLGEALLSYFALAGEVVYNSLGEPEILCNNRGVDFVEAFANVELCDLNLYNPDQSVEGKLVPQKKNGVVSIQATELKCGGTVVACTFDHRVVDGYSANMFLVSWAEIGRSKPISKPPSFRRSVLNPRHPLCVDTFIDEMYVPMSGPPLPKEGETVNDHLVSRVYYIEAEKLNEIQSLTNFNGCDNYEKTKLESFSAFLWKLVAKSTTIKNQGLICKMGIVVDGRTRLNQGENGNNVMSSYFGNVLSIPFRGHKSVNLIDKPLSWVASEVHDFLRNSVSQDHFLNLIDWVEFHRPDPAVTKIYVNGSDDGPAFVISSGQRFPISKVDFGWGNPFFGSYHFAWGGETGYVMPMPSTAVEGDWVVYLRLMKEQCEFIEIEAGDVFKPLTIDYLELTKMK